MCVCTLSGFLKVLEIPRGARHLLIQELRATSHTLGTLLFFSVFLPRFYGQIIISWWFNPAAVKNVASGLFFVNGENEYLESRSMIEKGVEWEYEYDDGKETLQTTGPLRHGILIMVLKLEDASNKFCTSTTFLLSKLHKLGKLSDLFFCFIHESR